MDRLNLYNVVEVDGKQEYDYLSHDLNSFQVNYPVQLYIVTEDDLLRPDLISYKLYGSVQYWWVVCYMNDIDDVFKDLEVGMQLSIPHILDLLDFYKEYKKK